MSQQLIVIIGPTASGKTKYAVKLAAELDGEILSADSRQLYRGMDIGTGKDLEEYNYNGVEIPYHLIDIVEPGYHYNIFQYQKDFHKAFEEIKGRSKVPILCGGSGLYIEAVTEGYQLEEVEPDYKLRGELEGHSTEKLIEMLKERRALHNSTDITSRKRLIRALEIAIHSKGEVQSYPPIECLFIGMKVSKEERWKRIERRLKERFKEGMVEEVERLMEGGVTAEQLIYYGLEYKFITLYLTGKLSREEMEQQLLVAIRQFSKRQMTWFRRMERRGVVIEWVTP